MSLDPLSTAVLGAATAGWYGARLGVGRAQPLLVRLTGARIAGYLGMVARKAATLGLIAALVWWLERTSGRGDMGAALREMGLHFALPLDQVAALTLLMFAASYAVSLAVLFLRRVLKRYPTARAANIIPQSRAERLVFGLAVSPAAGIVEEIVYRGFLMWILTDLTQDPVSAVGTQAVVFGMMHLYQGGLGILRTGAIGLILGAGTLVSGSLIPAILAHTLLDMATAVVRFHRPAAS